MKPRSGAVLAAVVTMIAALSPGTTEAATAYPRRLLYSTNSGMLVPGGTNDGRHDTTTFAIQPSGTLTPYGAPAPGVVSPRGIVFADDGRTAYVADSGGDTVAPFRVEPDGTLVPLSDPVPSGDLPFGIAVAPNGRGVYVAHFNSADVTAFRVDEDGGLHQFGPPVHTGQSHGKGVAVTPDSRFVYVATGTPIDQVPDAIVRFDLNPDGSIRARGPATPIGVSGSGIVITPDGQFVYVACQGSDEVWGFRIEPDGALTQLPGLPILAPDFSEGAAIGPDGEFLYVTALGGQQADEDGVYVFAIGDDGSLTQVGDRIPTGDGPGAATTTADGKFVYISNFRSDDISAYRVLPTGRLEELPSSPYLTGGDGPAFGAVQLPPDEGPTARFSAVANGRTVQFDASGSTDPDGRVARYDWDFGDGTVLQGGTARPRHVFRQSGTYSVTVTVTDDEGCSTRRVSFGQSASCAGSPRATHTKTVAVE
ncbi:beta-propeller fold lactonase family protein [Actinophytocola sp.]|uniref:beta-propeller fold lactonase family protein n=1 Tax=Actinophytocola sp. TaxID=1872138 RepID=UPI002ED5B0E8